MLKRKRPSGASGATADGDASEDADNKGMQQGAGAYAQLAVLLHNALVVVNAQTQADARIPPPSREIQAEALQARDDDQFEDSGSEDSGGEDSGGDKGDAEADRRKVFTLYTSVEEMEGVEIDTRNNIVPPMPKRRMTRRTSQKAKLAAKRTTLADVYYLVYLRFFRSAADRLLAQARRIEETTRDLTVEVLRLVNTWYKQSREAAQTLPTIRTERETERRAPIQAPAQLSDKPAVDYIQPSEINGTSPAVVRNTYLPEFIRVTQKQPNAESDPLVREIQLKFRTFSYLDNLYRQLTARLNPATRDTTDSSALQLGDFADSSRDEQDMLKAFTGSGGDVPSPLSLRRFDWLYAFYRELHGLEDFVGLAQVKNTIAAYFQTKLFVSDIDSGDFSNFSFFGNPGTGKTEVAVRMGRLLYYNCDALFKPEGNSTVTSRKDFVAPYEGQTAPMTNAAFMNTALGGVMVIDEAYALVQNDRDSYGLAALAELIKLMSEYRGVSIVIIAGYEKEIRESLYARNPGMSRRFPFSLYFDDYTADELIAIGQQYLEKRFRGMIEFTPAAAVEFARLVRRIKAYGRLTQNEKKRAIDQFATTNAGGMRNLVLDLVRTTIVRSGGQATLESARLLLSPGDRVPGGARWRITKSIVQQVVYASTVNSLDKETRAATSMDEFLGTRAVQDAQPKRSAPPTPFRGTPTAGDSPTASETPTPAEPRRTPSGFSRPGSTTRTFLSVFDSDEESSSSA